MDDSRLTRRAVLRSIGTTLAAGGLFDWADVASAAHDAHAIAQSPLRAAYSVLSAADGADIEALTEQIVPGDDTPGATQAGVSWFIDRALGSFFAHWRPGFTRGLAEFQAAVRAAFPHAMSFALLEVEQQVAFLRTVDKTPFFEQARLLTLCGMFSSPVWGGNRNGVGWALIGFEDKHLFEPPFGYYDSDA